MARAPAGSGRGRRGGLIRGRVLDPVYGRHFELFANCAIDELRAALDRRPDTRGADRHDDDFWNPEDEPRGRSFELRFDDGREPRAFIWLRAWRGMATVPVLHHEVLHHALTTFEAIGITVTDASDEALCYYVEFLTREALLVLEGK